MLDDRHHAEKVRILLNFRRVRTLRRRPLRRTARLPGGARTRTSFHPG